MTDLANFIRSYDNALPAELCANIIKHFESEPELQERNGRTQRQGLSESSWLERDFTNLQAFNFQNIVLNCLKHYKSAYERDCGIRPPLPEPSLYAPLIIKRYDANGIDSFQAHFDSIAEVSNRYMVFLWYLNDVETGGETDFLDLGIKSSAKCGKLVIFPPYWMYRHEAMPPVSNPKYILSTYPLW